MSGMGIEVDKERCVRAGMCALTAPDGFTHDDGFSEMLPGRLERTGDHSLVREAVRACPVGAVSLTDG